MQEFFRSKLFKTLLVVAAILLGLITFEIFSDGQTIFKTAIRTATQPLIKSTNFVNNSVSGFFDEFFKSGKHKEENVLLKQELVKAQKALVSIDELKNENEQLKQMLNFKKEHPDFDIEIANFLAKDPDSVYNFIIDAGKNKKISVGSTVLTNMGLVGKIIKVDKNQSVVSNILDLDEKIPATINLKQEKGLICGDSKSTKSGLCTMNHLPKATTAAKGDLVYTSGTGGIYPANIIIGSVVEVKLNDNGISREAKIKPAQDLNNIESVIVIKNSAKNN